MFESTPTVTITTLLSACETVLSTIIDLAKEVLEFIVSNPVTMLGFTLAIIGLAINLVRKFAYR